MKELAHIFHKRSAAKCIKHSVYSGLLKKHSQHTDSMPASIFLRKSLCLQHLLTFRDDLGEICVLGEK